MNKKSFPKLITIVSLVVALAVAIPVLSGCLPGQAPEAEAPEESKVVIAKIGFLAPLTGPAAGWGLPGLYGDEIWVEHFNAKGGITLSDGTQVLVELVPYDNEYLAEKALSGGKKLVLEDEVVLVQMLGGYTAPAIVPWFTEHSMLSTTLVATDLAPTTLYHLAPVEVHPFYDVTSIEWLAENRPDLKTMAITAQNDELGVLSVAAKVAAAKAAGIEVIYQKLFDIETVDFAPIVTDILSTNPDILSWAGSYPDFVNLLTKEASDQGYEGQLESCSLDFYDTVIDLTSAEFMDGFVWQFPDFDDPALLESLNPYQIVEPQVFWDEYNEKYPGTWSAVSWEYQSILNQWAQAVIYADSIDPMEVFTAWKEAPTIYHTFGEGTWWGKPFWGIDNALMAPWPIVQMQDEKATIVGFLDPLDWWERNKEYLIDEYEQCGQMWYQKMGIPKEEAIEKYGLLEAYK